MKNIHVLQKNIFNQLGVDHYGKTPTQIKIAEFLINKNIYITSNEEIKEGDYSFYPPFGVGKNIFIDGELCFHIESKYGKGSFTQKTYQTLDRNKKIILTTDQDLIADGIQAIDDEFLEWFVKNPSCKNVEVEKTFVTNSGLGYQEYAVLNSDFKVLEVVATRPQSSYKIGLVTKLDDYEYVTEYKIIIPQEESKQETLEEAAEKYSQGWGENDDVKSFIAGANYQAERMYSEEEVEQIFNIGQMIKNYGNYKPYTFKEALEQFKKK